MLNKLNLSRLAIMMFAASVLVSSVIVLLQASIAEAAVPLKVVKAIDEVHTFGPLQDDSELVISLKKNETYIIDGELLFIQGGNICDIAFILPPGAQFLTSVSSQGSSYITSGDSVLLQCSDNTATHLSGSIRMGSTNGTLQLQWSGAENGITTLESGSWLRADKI